MISIALIDDATETQLFSFQSITVNCCWRRQQSVTSATHCVDCCLLKKYTTQTISATAACSVPTYPGVSNTTAEDQRVCVWKKKEKWGGKKESHVSNRRFFLASVLLSCFRGFASTWAAKKEPACCRRRDGLWDTHLATASGKKQSAAYWPAAVCDFINRGRPKEVRRIQPCNTSLHSTKRPPLACLVILWM